ncbi:conserved hypothetical protein [Pseudomonas aeruginosa C3719]|nr:conserved hypothetical protein [Pseudomonas aeruginosa C3719]
MFNDLSRMGKYLGQAARMLGRHARLRQLMSSTCATRHSDKSVMTYEEVFRRRQEARYGGGKGRPIRCC